jgi:uncharacterized membrane protein YfcA
MHYALLLLFGIAVGIVSGLLGIGGGVVLVPGLVYLFGFSQPEAQGTSLAVLIPPIGLFAAIVYYQHGFVRVPVVGWLALGIVVGAVLGAKAVPLVPVTALRLSFGVLMLYLGFAYVLSPGASRTAAALPAGLAALTSAALFFWRRNRLKKSAQHHPPGDDVEYHI